MQGTTLKYYTISEVAPFAMIQREGKVKALYIIQDELDFLVFSPRYASVQIVLSFSAMCKISWAAVEMKQLVAKYT